MTPDALRLRRAALVAEALALLGRRRHALAPLPDGRAHVVRLPPGVRPGADADGEVVLLLGRGTARDVRAALDRREGLRRAEALQRALAADRLAHARTVRAVQLALFDDALAPAAPAHRRAA